MDSRRDQLLNLLPPLLITAGVILIIGWASASAYLVVNSVDSLLQQQDAVEELFATNLTEADAGEIREIVTTTKKDIDRIESVLSPLAPLMSRLGWIPRVGLLLEAAPELLEMAVAGSDLAVYGYNGLEPLLSEIQNPAVDGLSGGLIVKALDDASEDLHSAREAYNRLAAARAEMARSEELPWRIRTMIDRLDDVMPLVEDGLILGQATPSLLGANGQRTFLILAQNEDEIRPTGGFISGAGVVSLDHGELVSINFEDANFIGNVLTKPYDWPPPPYREFMGLEYFLFRDANYWPDFPTSAEQAITLYTYDRGTRIDGAIAIDQEFLRRLLSEIGPVNVPALERNVSSDNVVSLMREQWGPQSGEEYWIRQRNDFMEPLARALLARLTGNLRELEPLGLARMIQNAASEKHLQVYARNPEAAQLLEEAGWAGRNHFQGRQDYLNVIDMNVGYNKANAIVDRGVTYHVVLERDGTGSATLTLQYTHIGNSLGNSCEHGLLPYTEDFQYRNLVNQCYWDYLRVYTPKGSIESNSSQQTADRFLLLTGWYVPSLNQIFHENSETFEIFEELLLLPTGQEKELTFTYRLPPVVQTLANERQEYRLNLKKQSGLISQDAKVTIVLPEGSSLLSTAPIADSVGNQGIVFTFEQRTDLEISIIYQLGDSLGQ